MARPRGIGSGNGSGLAGVAIMAMENVWLICVLVALSPLGGDRGVGRGLELDAGAWPAVVADFLGIRNGGTRGNVELPGRGLVEFDRLGKDDMVKA
jgi:hypothetical protein